MFGCELRKDGSKGNFARYAYDGRDHVSFNLGTWTAADVEAQITKTWLEGETNEDQSLKVYLEEECIEWLQKFLNFGRESLLRTESPVGKVTHQTIGGDQEALICQANGFYPKEIEATWRKGEEILEHETFRRSIAPNSDGTYYIWLSIEIDPKQRDLYQCHVDHASLTEPLVLAFKKPDSMVLIVGSIVGFIAAGLVICITFFFKFLRRRRAYKEVQTDNQKSVSYASSISSAKSLLPAVSEPVMIVEPSHFFSAMGTEIYHQT